MNTGRSNLLDVHEHRVSKQRRRSVQDGIEVLTDEYRAGWPRTVCDSQIAQVVERTLNTSPKDAGHRSIRSMAADSGLSLATLRRVWAAVRPFVGPPDVRFFRLLL